MMIIPIGHVESNCHSVNNADGNVHFGHESFLEFSVVFSELPTIQYYHRQNDASTKYQSSYAGKCTDNKILSIFNSSVLKMKAGRESNIE